MTIASVARASPGNRPPRAASQPPSHPRRRIARGAACLAALLLVSCAAGAPQQPKVSKEEQEILRRQERVVSVGAEFPFLWDAEVLSVMRRVGDDIARAVGAPEDAFHYYILDKPILNAFTSPTGDIFFFTGQLAAMRNRSELAGVLAHEIAHVRAGHYERIQRSAALGTVPAMAAIILSQGNPAVLAGAIALLESYQLSFSREMESEADRLSLVYLRKTSYDPAGLLGALRLIELSERLVSSEAPTSLRSHPKTPVRIGTLEDGLGLPPGEQYRPAADPVWDRVRAIILATDEPERALREFGARAAGGGALDADLLGIVLFRRGDHAAAAREFRRAVAAAPGEARYAIDLGVALYFLGEPAEARTVLEAARLLPGGGESSLPWHYLGEILREEGKSEEALACYRRATELDPQLAESHYQLALALSGAGRRGEADFSFGRASALRGDYAGALRSLRRSRELLGGDPLWRSRIEKELKHME
jgi:predicted Zn-dependent protease